MAQIGKYEILSEIGRGGMGVVYRARDPYIGRLVALKTISRDIAQASDLRQRFLLEARAAGSLQHPNIVTIYEIGEADGAPYIAMEYLEGQSLEQIISRAMTIRLVHKVRYIVELCRGIQYAHRFGVIHRDIKPSNIFITVDGIVKIVDFGIARLADTSSKTRDGVIVGTMGYLSPEQLRGEPATQGTDIWAVGVTAYELVSYQKPFHADSLAGLIEDALSREPSALTELVPTCPIELSDLIAGMLRKDPQKRFQTIDSFLPRLERIYKNLADLSVRELLNLSEDWLKANDSVKAVDSLREVLEIDSSNVEAMTLLEEAQSALEGQSVTTKLQAMVVRARALLQQEKFQDARKELDAAIQIDPAYEPALQLTRELRTREVKAKGSLGGAAKSGFSRTPISSVEERKEHRTMGVTALDVKSPPTGFFGSSAIPRTGFFEGDQVRYKKVQETLKFYRDHLNGEYHSLSNQAKLTYYLWIISVVLGLATLVAGVILLFLGKFAAGSISVISTTFVYFIQKVFQQREDHYRSLATAKQQHLEYGNHWLLVIQSIDAIENQDEKERRQGQLVDVLTRKLETIKNQARPGRTMPSKRKKPKQAGS